MENRQDSLLNEITLRENESRFNTHAGTISIFTAAHRLMLVAEHIRRLDSNKADERRIVPDPSVDGIWMRWLSEQSSQFPGLQSIQGQKESGFSSLPSATVALRSLIKTIALPHLHESFLGRKASEEDRLALSMLSEAAQVTLQAMVDRASFERSVERSTQQAIYDFAYGLTHEINNPLANIAARAQQLLVQATAAADQKSLATIVDQSMRAHEMLAEMMRAVKPKAWSPVTVPISECIQPLLSRFHKAFQARQIGFEVEGTFDQIAVSTEAAEFREAIASLLQNALDACSPSDSVLLTVRTWDDCVELSVKDTGCGMSHQAVEKAFSLYYSGREHGRGLGISLANVRRVIDSMGGQLSIASCERTGTQVRVLVPATAMPTPKRSKRIRVAN